MTQNRTLSVVLPAYNEAACIETLLRRIGKALASERARRSFGEHGSLDWEIVVVDDGSSDQTAAIARVVGRTLPVRLVEHGVNKGLGAAMRTGLRAAADSTVVVTMDADNTHDPDLIPDMITKLLQGADVVIASRFEPGGAEVGVPPHRKFISHAASGIMQLMARVEGARDYSCGYRAYRGELLRRLIEAYGPDTFITENGFACMVELLLRAATLGARVSEVPLVLRYDLKEGASKMKVARTTRRYASVIGAYRAGFPPVPPPDSSPVRGDGALARAVNAGMAVAGLTFAAPLFLAAAAAVKLSSGGPLFTREVRVGKDRRRLAPVAAGRRGEDLGGAPFEILRFRTRYEDRRGAGRGSADGFRDAPPLTPVGRVLDRYRLDRLPELINVVRGDMNLVGPRPAPPEAVQRLRDRVDGYSARHSVRPGITGLAQLRVPAANGTDDLLRQTEYDLEYVQKKSLVEDVLIMARTVPAVFTSGHPA